MAAKVHSAAVLPGGAHLGDGQRADTTDVGLFPASQGDVVVDDYRSAVRIEGEDTDQAVGAEVAGEVTIVAISTNQDSGGLSALARDGRLRQLPSV